MTHSFFEFQMKRLRAYFRDGEHVYTRDKTSMIWTQVRDLPDENFKTVVDLFIGENTPEWPPRLSDFTINANEQRKILLRRASAMAFGELKREATRRPDATGLKKILDEMGVKSVVEAIQKKKASSR